ncbi:MAG: hypothetical protein ACOVQJ_02295 [Bacteroidia bacterium]
MARKKKKYRNWVYGLVFILIAVIIVWRLWSPKTTYSQDIGPEYVLENYGIEIQQEAYQLQLPPEYFAALCMLESGGRKPCPPKFEKHVYAKLKMVHAGTKVRYEHVTPHEIGNASDGAIRNLASSWGPFQIMGYKCLLLDVNIEDLRGPQSVHWSMRWINENYGSYLRKKDYKSAFHMHNAGSPFPKNGKTKTHDPNYVKNGLKWMNYFKGKL